MNKDSLRYPQMHIHLQSIYHNAYEFKKLCNSCDINLAGVVKGMNGSIEVAKVFKKAGYQHIASSRLSELIPIYQENLNIPLMLVRIPMLSEIYDLVKYVDISLNSERKVLDAINDKCQELGKHHSVILMMDLGDLREGFFSEEALLETALYVEKELSHVLLKGIGTNLSCYGSVMPTPTNLKRLVQLSKKIESEIHRSLEIVSGGATTTLPLVFNHEIPKGINHLRLGESVLLAADLEDFFNIDLSNYKRDTITLKAEIIEIKDKASHPIGELSIDAFGNKPHYEDHGIRKRALLALGKKDIGHHSKIIPKDNHIKVIGSSSDHLIIDVSDSKISYTIGDILEFNLYYPAMLYGSQSSNVTKVYFK